MDAFCELKRDYAHYGYSITSVACDPFEELIWTGDSMGKVTSFTFPSMDRFSYFHAPLASPSAAASSPSSPEIRQLLPLNTTGIVTLTASNASYFDRGGLSKCSLSTASMTDLACLAPSIPSQPNSLVLAGNQPSILIADLYKQRIVKEFDITQEYTTSGGITAMKRARFLCTGTQSGLLQLRDPKTLRVEHQFEAHTGPVTDMDMNGNFLATCGYTQRSGNLFSDSFVKLYDLRMVKSALPVNFPAGAFKLRFLPKFTSRLAIVSSSGMVQFCDALGGVFPAFAQLYLEEGTFCTSLDVSTSCQVLAFGDTLGQVSEWLPEASMGALWAEQEEVYGPQPVDEAGNPIDRDYPIVDDAGQLLGALSALHINEFSSPTEYATPEPLPLYSGPPIAVDDFSKPLSLIGVPFSDEPLASDWLPTKTIVVRRPPTAVDDKVLKSMKTNGSVGYAPNNPALRKRNQVPHARHWLDPIGRLLSKGRKSSVSHPKSRSQPAAFHGLGSSPFKSGGFGSSSSPARPLHGLGQSASFDEMSLHQSIVPPKYRKIEVKYTRMGIEDIDLNSYNTSWFAGLEPQSPNAYCSPFLQVLYFLPPLHSALQNHLCWKESCLACELGFLFHMLDLSPRGTCQANNFIRAFRTVPQASALGLILSDDFAAAKAHFPRLIQSFSRFLLQQVHQDMATHAPQHQSQHQSQQQQQQQQSRQPSSIQRAPTPVSQPEALSFVQTVFATSMTLRTKCICEQEQLKENESFIFDLSYPMLPTSVSATGVGTIPSTQLDYHLQLQQQQLQPIPSFAKILYDTFRREQTTKAWCERCNKFQNSVQTRAIKSLPPVLVLNTAIEKEGGLEYWQALEKQIKLKYQAELKEAATRREHHRAARHFHPSPDSTAEGGSGDTSSSLHHRHHPQQQQQRHFGSSSHSAEASHAAHPLPEAYIPLSLRLSLHPDRKQPQQAAAGSSLSSKNAASFPDMTIEQFSEDQPTPSHPSSSASTTASAEYILIATIAQVRDDNSPTSHLVAHVRVPTAYEDRAKSYVHSLSGIRDEHSSKLQRLDASFDASKWFLLNDFTVSEVTVSEATSFNLNWKIPCVFVYAQRESTKLEPPLANPITISVLKDDAAVTPVSASSSAGRKHAGPLGLSVAAQQQHQVQQQLGLSKRHAPSPYQPASFISLRGDESIRPGDLFAIDAEFVALNPEEAQLRSDGSRATLKLAQFHLARVTVIRGQGPLDGVPLMDDYISTSEQVSDYLTKFSGINPGDLDASLSSKHLTTLKAVYLKLRYLVDAGVKFVGHGLQKDFRVINIVVPPDQVIDTVELFSRKRQRKVSLRFLCWFLLKLDIQSETHDSVEDARTALLLYRKYLELERDGKVEQTLNEIYEAGRIYGWRAPHWAVTH